MFAGRLILESLRLGTDLRTPGLRMDRVLRVSVDGATSAQPDEWSIVDFRGPDESADGFAEQLAEALEPTQHWYADFRIGADHVVIFPGKVIRYRTGDADAHAEAVEYGLTLGIPADQLDWGEPDD
ncbi:MAG TPA: hypothetical protein VFK68_09980 [Propionibacteriaceae bacterium]|nr:hypothetical protein [Propionibacteriaceae bacterium]